MNCLLRALVPLALTFSLGAAVPEFEPNSGQAEQQYLFLARAGANRVYIKDRALELATTSASPVRLSWLDSVTGNDSLHSGWQISEATGNTTHYCLGGKSTLCTEGVRSYRKLLRKNLYPGIDWELHGRSGQLEYDLVLHPGSTLRDVRLRVEGAPAEVSADGRLRAGSMLHWQPEAYQVVNNQRVAVSAALRASGKDEFEFVVGEYDASHDLIIDPVVQGIGVAGGGDEDETRGFLSESNSSCTYSYGTTRSADWHHLPAAAGRHVFVQVIRRGFGSTTYFWGGEGDEFLGGADSDLNNCRLYLTGWTTSRNAPVLSSTWERMTAQPYSGGPTDGFFLKFSWEGLGFAGYVGGPGADRLYDVRNTASSGYDGTFLFAGQTDDTSWVGSTRRRIGSGGKTDAILVAVDDVRMSILALGGAGDDRMMRIRNAGDGFWAIAGETDSPDFPVREGAAETVKAAAGKDLWVGRLRLDPSELSVLQIYGGSGEDQMGGLGVLPKQGIYLAGTTTSHDLPAVSNAYHGGDADGFVTYLDPLTATPQVTSYIGGTGRDEIAAADARNDDVFLGGTTDSDELTLPGLTAGQDVRGGLDALFVLCDAFGAPMRGIRLGGSADDRVLGIAPGDLGKVILAGSSASREWLSELDAFHVDSSGLDGFVASVSFPAVRISGYSESTPGRVILGRDLQVPMSVLTTSEAGMDGILLVRSSDPSRLLVSARSDLPGAEKVLLEGTDQTYSYSIGNNFVLQALADSGEVELIVEGRSASSTKGTYPQRRIPVSLSPAALFISSPKAVNVPVNSGVDVTFFSAPLLPDGSSGRMQAPRLGKTSTPGLVSSDPDGLQIVSDSIREGGFAGSYTARATALKSGTYTLTPSTTQFPAGPGQSVTVRVTGSPAGTRLFGDQPLVLAKDHLTSFSFSGVAGDQLQFTSEDPGRLVLGNDNNASSGSLAVSMPASAPTGKLVIAALAGEGTVRVGVEGTYQGRSISESLLVYLVPYKAAMNSLPGRVASGVQLYIQAQLVPQTSLANAANPEIPYMTPRPGLVASLQLRSSNPSVLQVLPFSYSPLNFSAMAAQVGEAVLDFGPNAPVEFAEVRASVKVVAPTLDFGVDVLRIPAGANLSIYPSIATRASANALQAVRLRLSADAPVTLEKWSQSGTDITVDFSGGYGVLAKATNARPGDKATLFVSAPGVPEFALPIRIVEAVLLPFIGEMQVAPLNGAPASGDALYSIGAYDEGLVVRMDSGRLSSSSTLKLRPRLNPPGICELTQDGELSSNGGLTVPFTCARSGVTELSLEPVEGLTAAQSRFTIRIVSLPATNVPLPILPRVLTGIGLQALISMNSVGGVFNGTITSNDPDRVRLALDPKAPGSAKVTIPPQYYSSVYVQGFDSQGTATLTAETPDGRKTEITVYLLPSTLVVRPHSNYGATDKQPMLFLDHPLSSTDLNTDIFPALVDPGTRKLIWSSNLSIRGGTDPAFLRAKSSDSSVVEPVAPDAIVSEGDTIARLNFRVKSAGEALLTALQPDGFVEVPDSSLRVHVAARQLSFSSTPVLSADLQMPVSVVGVDGSAQASTTVTVTSLDPDKLRISSDGSSTGEASITAALGRPVYLQALSAAAPGETVRVRLEAPGYYSTERDVEFLPAELQLVYPESTLALIPLSSRSLSLRYGPVDSRGQLSSGFSGQFRPGVRLPVRISTSDSSIVTTSNPDITLDTYFAIVLQPVAPGRAQVHIETPPQIVNRASSLDAVVGLFEFPSVSLGNPVRYLVSRFTVANPRPQPTSLSVSSDGAAPLRFGLAPSGPDAPSASTFQITLAGKETRSLYVEPVGPGSPASVRLDAPDFKPASSATYLPDPQARFDPASPLNLSLASGTAQIAITLAEANRSSTGLPLGAAFGPLKLQLESSNPQVVRVTAPTVEFAAGDTRRNIGLELVSRGDAVVSLTMPASFSGASSVRQDLVVSVR